MGKILKPNEEMLEFIKNNYTYDDGKINSYKYYNVGYLDGKYIKIDIKKRAIKRSHIVWFLCKGEWPVSQLDHIDRNKHNDKIDNLREVDSFMQNQNKDNYKGYRGFSIEPKLDGRYRRKNLRIHNKSRGLYIGLVENFDEAVVMIDDWYESNSGGGEGVK